ncbi:MAG: UDP diphosphate synthase, partial [Methanothrix sp.]
MISRLYEQLLEMRISKGTLPGCIAIVLSSGDLLDEGLCRLKEMIEWSGSIGLSSLVLYINDTEPALCQKIADSLHSSPAQISLHTADEDLITGLGGSLKVAVSLGYG